jgi:hypothetical protein
MHGAGGQGRKRGGIYLGKVGAIAQAVDGAAHLLPGARLLFIQCHRQVSGCLLEFL